MCIRDRYFFNFTRSSKCVIMSTIKKITNNGTKEVKMNKVTQEGLCLHEKSNIFFGLTTTCVVSSDSS